MARSKKKALKAHFERRSIERIGVLLNEKELIKKIQANELEFVERQSNRVTVFRYKFKGENYRLVYDKTRKQIITVLFEKKEA
jgi:hypothetical protein